MQKKVQSQDRSQVFKSIKNFEAHGTCEDRWQNNKRTAHHLVGLVSLFNGISTFLGYLMP